LGAFCSFFKGNSEFPLKKPSISLKENYFSLGEKLFSFKEKTFSLGETHFFFEGNFSFP